MRLHGGAPLAQTGDAARAGLEHGCMDCSTLGPPERMHSDTPEEWQWFREAQYGLFVHWGPYATLGRGEQVLFREHLDQRAYERAACAWPHSQRPCGAPRYWQPDKNWPCITVRKRLRSRVCQWLRPASSSPSSNSNAMGGHKPKRGIARGSGAGIRGASSTGLPPVAARLGSDAEKDSAPPSTIPPSTIRFPKHQPSGLLQRILSQ